MDTNTEGKAVISRGEEGESSEAVATPDKKNLSQGEHVARVGFAAGVTLNMGDYESARVEVRIDLPCRPHSSVVDKVYQFAHDWVHHRLEEEVANMRTQGEEE